MSVLLPILARYWQAIVGGVAVLILSVILSHRTHERDTAYISFWQVKGAYDTTARSLADARAAIDAKNAETNARAQAFADSKAADAKAISEMKARQKADGQRVEVLADLAKTIPAGGCKAPAAIIENVRGL